MSDEEFEADLRAAFENEYDADEQTAATAAEKAAAFRADYREDLSVADVTDRLDDAADDYDAFEHRYDYAIGDLAAETDDCTDSREYRIAGFGDIAADPDMGA